ncbi:MAG: hypothetical protein K2O04_02430 [Clostridiales bacterium]|nr:hypothetical protein [Clostridiales bacterium]
MAKVIKGKSFLIVLLLLTIMTITCLAPCVAFASDTDDIEVNPPNYKSYSRLYYFSDSVEDWEERNSAVAKLADAAGLTDYTVNRYQSYLMPDFEYQFLQMYYGDEFDDIDDSLVIFEIRKGLSVSYAPVDVIRFTDILEEVFAMLKGNGCEIMLVLGTDEERIIGSECYNGICFLDYVDFHFNTDVFYCLVDTMFQYIENIQVNNVAFMLDHCLSEDWFIEYWLIPFVREYYEYEWKYYHYTYREYADRELWKDKEIYIYADSSVYHSSEAVINLSDRIIGYNEYDDWADNSVVANVFPIGMTACEEVLLNRWANAINMYAESYLNENPPTYLYECSNSVPPYSYGEIGLCNLRNEGWSLVCIDYWLPDVINDFINDNYAQYNNYDGSAVISHRMFYEGGEGGWKCVPTKSREFAQINQTVEY